MSQILDTAKELRFREHSYEPIAVTKFGGLNSDVRDEARPDHEAKEMHNMRFEREGVPVTRSGVRLFDFQPTATDESGTVTEQHATAIAKCECVFWHTDQLVSRQSEYRYDVTLYWNSDSHEVAVLLHDKSQEDSTPARFAIRIASAIADEPQGSVMQYGQYLIISLYDNAEYIAWPKALPPGSSQSDWNVESLGLDVSPIPNAYDIVPATSGDLFLFQSHDGGNESTMTYDLPTDGRASDRAKPIELPIPLDTAYLLATDASLGLTKQFTWANTDVTHESNPKDFAVKSPNHYEHRGWYYRFIAIRQIADSEGNPVKIRCHPSTDMFVKDAIYNPFFWADDTGLFPNESSGGSDPQWFTDIDFHDATIKPRPSKQAFLDLQTKWRKYFGSSTDNKSAGGTGGTMEWAAHWLGWRDDPLQHYQRLPPWKVEVPASELKNAPMTIFDYSKFFNIPFDTIEIEIYRTAYQGVDPKTRDVDTPDFQPHVYGYVGSLKPGATGAGTFTDDVKIPDFGRDPANYEGYLRGQFSGEVSTAYGQSPSVVVGNVRVDYKLLTPTPLVQAFLFEDISDHSVFTPESFKVQPGEDALPHVLFYYAYEDDNGYRSEAMPIFSVTPSGDTLGGIPVAIAFTFPRGYTPNITNIVLYRATYNVAKQVREYFEIATVPVEPGTYTSYGTEPASSVGQGALTDASKPKFYEPGAIIYSEPDQPWFWKPESIEKHHASDPVRRLEVLMGELLVTTDSSNTLTQLRQEEPRSEEETKWIGCVAKNAGAKVSEAAVFLSQDNMYFMVPSRPERLRSKISAEILKYLLEKIPGQKPLANIRRASCGYLGRRSELWLHIPSSKDLWPADQKMNALPHRTFVWHFGENEEGATSIRIVENYTFDLSPYFEIKNLALPPLPGGGPPIAVQAVDQSTYRSNTVYFASGSDGSLYASYSDAGIIHTINCDVPTVDFQATAALTMSFGLSTPDGQKQIRRTVLKMAARGQANIITGIPKRSERGLGTIDGWDALRGFINERATVYSFRNIRTDQDRSYMHPGVDSALETKGNCVMIRLRTNPDAQSRHRIEVRGLAIYLDLKHQHGG